jgi:hypothetical protein
MAYTLGDLTLPRPHAFTRSPVEYSTKNESLTGRTTKDIRNRKEQYRLSFKYLTQAEVLGITTEYDRQSTLKFSVSDGSLTIAETDVHMEITGREYNTPGSEYREDLDIILTEEA